MIKIIKLHMFSFLLFLLIMPLNLSSQQAIETIGEPCLDIGIKRLDSTGKGLPMANVINSDDRRVLMPIDMQSLPFSAIGQLSNPGSHCTASLISSNLILTNYHCIDKNSVFYPAYHNGPSMYGGTNVIKWFHDNRENDWAIGLLDKHVGNETGWLKIVLIDQHLRRNIKRSDYILAGYSGDIENGSVMSVHQMCALQSIDKDQIVHCCDMTRGASGSPIFSFWPAMNVWALIAVNNAEIRRGTKSEKNVDCREYPNFAVPSNTFYYRAMELIEEYGQGVCAPYNVSRNISVFERPNYYKIKQYSCRDIKRNIESINNGELNVKFDFPGIWQGRYLLDAYWWIPVSLIQYVPVQFMVRFSAIPKAPGNKILTGNTEGLSFEITSLKMDKDGRTISADHTYWFALGYLTKAEIIPNLPKLEFKYDAISTIPAYVLENDWENAYWFDTSSPAYFRISSRSGMPFKKIPYSFDAAINISLKRSPLTVSQERPRPHIFAYENVVLWLYKPDLLRDCEQFAAEKNKIKKAAHVAENSIAILRNMNLDSTLLLKRFMQAYFDRPREVIEFMIDLFSMYDITDGIFMNILEGIHILKSTPCLFAWSIDGIFDNPELFVTELDECRKSKAISRDQHIGVKLTLEIIEYSKDATLVESIDEFSREFISNILSQPDLHSIHLIKEAAIDQRANELLTFLERHNSDAYWECKARIDLN